MKRKIDAIARIYVKDGALQILRDSDEMETAMSSMPVFTHPSESEVTSVAIRNIVTAALALAYCPPGPGYRNGPTISQAMARLIEEIEDYTGVPIEDVRGDDVSEEEVIARVLANHARIRGG
jgi:hypothetical protein